LLVSHPVEPEQVNSDDAAGAAQQVVEVVRAVLAELHPGQQDVVNVELDSSLDRDLGLDSLGRTELLARLEKRFDVILPEQVLVTGETPRDLLQEVLRAGAREKPSAAPAAAAVAESPTGAVALPHAAATLVDVLAWHAARHPDRPHIRLYNDESAGELITYGALLQGAEELAVGLQLRDLAPGEAVLIMLPTGRDYFFAFFGVLLAGGVPVPVYPPGRLKQIEEHLRRHAAIAANCRARVMISMEEAMPFVRLMHALAPDLRHVVTVAELGEGGSAADLRRPAVAAADIAFLQYTSGSTGAPKGVVLTHANLLANIRAMGRAIRVDADDVFVSWLPLYHDMGLIGAWLGSLYHAAQLVIMPPLSFIARPARWLTAIHRFGGTLSAAPNFAYDLCLRRIDDQEIAGLDLSSWRCAFNGAEAVNTATMTGFLERFARCGLRPGAMMPVYGLAESSVGLAFPPLERGVLIDRVRRRSLMEQAWAEPAAADDATAIAFVGCGHPLAGHEIKIVDIDGRELPERREGRLYFRGPSATAGYFRNPEKSAGLFKGAWLDSGDKAYIVAGEVFITGRAKDIVIRAGRNIYPEEIEEEVGRLDGIRKGSVTVFGSREPQAGTERLVVLAETRRQEAGAQSRLRQKIVAIVTELVGEPPDEVVLAPPNTVLKTSSGKIRRAASREVYEKGEIGRPPAAVWLQVVRLMLTTLRPRLRQASQRFGSALYAGYCWSMFGLAAPIIWSGLILLPGEARRLVVLAFALRLLSRLSGLHFRVEGFENLLPPGQPCVYASNHASYLDGYFLLAALPRQFSFVAKAELQAKRSVRLLLTRLGCEFVERFDKQGGVAAARRLAERSRAGRSLFFFVEGTLVRMPGLLPFRMGAFETAARGGLPVLPVAIQGTRSILRADSWFPRRGRVRIHIGPAIMPERRPDAEEEVWAAALTLRDQARAWILRHCGEPDLGHERPQIFTANGQPPPA